jgi:hypothetical protein
MRRRSLCLPNMFSIFVPLAIERLVVRDRSLPIGP